jgi:hypothetical protein
LSVAWPRFLDEVAKKKPSLEPFLRLAHPELSSDGALRLLCRDEFQRSQIALNLVLLTELVQRTIGPVPVACAVSAGMTPPPPPPTSRAASSAIESAEEVVSDDEEPPPSEDDDGSAEPPRAAAVSAANEMADTSASSAEVEEIAALEPGLKKVLARFPGKLKRLDPPA